MTSNQGEVNPYRVPATEYPMQAQSVDASFDRTIIKKFRDQIHALGALSIILGGLVLVLLAVALIGENREIAAADRMVLLNLAVLAASCAVWVGLGIMACLKQLWAVYVGLVLSYLSLLQFLLTINWCGIVILIIVIVQAHRVINWGRKLQAAGVPLTAIP